MAQGYSLNLVEQNSTADGRRLGVRLGRLCIKHSVPVAVVAKRFGVTRQTVYNWFRGNGEPGSNIASQVEIYITALS
jgi:hypothetical protein